MSTDPEPTQTQIAAFIEAATSDLRRAEELLALHPLVAKAGFHAALVLGDIQQVERTIADSPQLAKTKGGPENLEPLLYFLPLCESLSLSARRRLRRNRSYPPPPRRRPRHYFYS
jgi:hypothetical protein